MAGPSTSASVDVNCLNCQALFSPRNAFDRYCPTCRAAMALEEGEERKRQHQIDRYRARGIGERFWNESLATFNPGKLDAPALDACISYCQQGYGQTDGRGLYIWSHTNGNGKTHLAVGVLVEAPFYGKLVNSIALLDSIKGSYNGETTELEDACERTKLLVLDDLGAERVTEWVLERFYLLINSRDCHLKPTIYTSNLSLTELEKRMASQNRELAGRICSRIEGSSDFIELRGIDRRRRRG